MSASDWEGIRNLKPLREASFLKSCSQPNVEVDRCSCTSSKALSTSQGEHLVKLLALPIPTGTPDGAFMVVASWGTTYVEQVYKADVDEFPLDWVKEQMAEGFFVTHVASRSDKWIVVMSLGASFFGKQLIAFSPQFPAKKVLRYWSKGRVHSLHTLGFAIEGPGGSTGLGVRLGMG